MALWNKVFSGFDKEEETVNFGTRIVTENNGQLYETLTVATIRCEEEVVAEPIVQASVQYSRICVIVDKSITIFKDETCHEILLNVSFDSIITCSHVSDDGLFVFIVLLNGTLHVLDLLNNGKVIFTKDITKNEDKVVTIFLQNEDEDCINVYLITKNGVIYRVSQFNKKVLQSVLQNKTTATTKIQNLAEEVQCSKLFNGFSNDEVTCAAVDSVNKDVSIAMLCLNKFFIWPSEQYCNFEPLCSTYIKVKFLRNHTVVLCLRKDNILRMVCPQTLLGINMCTIPISDFSIIETNENNSVQILGLAASDNCTTRTLHIFSFPEFEEKFQITVPITTYLVEIMDPCDETILYLEGVNDVENGTKYIDTIRIKAVSESDPEYQLQRLVKKEHFNAAETFAQKFNLSVESVYCAKAAKFLSQLGPWAKEHNDPVQVDTLLSLLDKIESVQYIAEYCSKALIPDYKQMRKIHMYARSRIIENTAKTKTDEHFNLLDLINNMLFKLETFHMIWGYQKDSEYYDNNTMNEWIRFQRANFLEEYKSHINLGEMDVASLIWIRHLPDIKKHVSIGTVKDIFASIPENISPSILWSWLSHFIPTLLSFTPNAIYEIISWGCKKIKLFEQTCYSEWPQIGIDFAQRFIKLLKLQENHHPSYYHQEYLCNDSNLKHFILLVQAMSDIEKLRTNYGIKMPLNIYIGDYVEVCYMLLDKVHTNLIPELVNTFLKQYMLNNSLQNDHVFSLYIQRTMRSRKSWWFDEEPIWEQKIIIIIDFIQNIEIKLHQTLNVLKKASIPWSPDITKLAETSCKFDHILASEIRTECNYVPIKLILKIYGYEHIGINDKLINRIIRKDHDDMISHIQCVTKNDPLLMEKAFSLCIHYYLSTGNITKAMKVLNSLETGVLLYCCVHIVNYAIATLTLKILPQSLTYHIEMLGWVKLQLKKLSEKCKTKSYNYNHIMSDIEEVKSTYFLRQEYQINITFQEYQINKKQILQNYIEKLCKVDIKKSEDFPIIYKRVIKVAELLKLPKIGAISLLLKWTKNIDLVRYEKESFQLMKQECRYIYEICLTILLNNKTDEDVVITIENLLSSALCVCSSGDLQSILLLCNWVNLYRQCSAKNVTYNSNSVDMKQNKLLKSNWTLYPIYRDLAVTANESLLLLFRNIISIQKFYVAQLKFDTEYLIIDGVLRNYDQLNTGDLFKKLLHDIKELKVEHNDYCFLQIIKTLYFNFFIASDISSALLSEITSVYFHRLIILLKKVISTQLFDLQLGLSCLFMLSESQACKWISTTYKSFQPDSIQHLRISILGCEYFRLIKDETFIQIFETNKMMHCWAQKLSKYSISYKEIITSDATTRREILQHIMDYSDDNIVFLLKNFCNDFGFDIQDCLLLYLQTVIKTWNPKLITNDLSGKTELLINEDEVNQLRKKCNLIATNIEDKIFLKNCVTSIFPQINFYYYEVFIILMDLLEDKSVEHRSYFCFLQNYIRVGQPTQIEYDAWMHLNPGHTSLPFIAKWRLPFLPKAELWKLITPELNLKTYEKWLDIAPVLKLQPHIICTLAIKGEIIRVWGNKSGTDKWILCLKNNSLLTDIKKCIERMTGPDALYYGTAALYYVVNHTPPGADQVAAVKECYEYAQLSAQKSVTFEEGLLEKIKYKYLRFTSEHILHAYGLGKKNYLALIGNPSKLIQELYTDESIPQRYQCVTDHRPDINSAVNSISELFSINIVKLRMELLQEWLQPNVKYIKFNQSMTDTFSEITNSESNSMCDDNLLRARYILEREDLDLSANFLISIGFGDGNEDYSFEARYRALYVLQTIVDTVTLEDLTKRDCETIRNYMKCLKYVSRLEQLGIGCNVNEFETCCKYELVQILWRTQNYSPHALVTIAQLCIDFKIYEYSLWDKTLSQLAKLLMVSELKNILLQVRDVSVIVNSNGYLLGWQAVISEPFRKMDIHPTFEQIDNCINALQLLYSCPVVHMMCFSEIIKYCFQCQQLHFAVALFPFLDDDDRKNVLKKHKDSFHIAKILEDLDKLALDGIPCVPYVSMINFYDCIHNIFYVRFFSAVLN